MERRASDVDLNLDASSVYSFQLPKLRQGRTPPSPVIVFIVAARIVRGEPFTLRNKDVAGGAEAGQSAMIAARTVGREGLTPDGAEYAIWTEVLVHNFSDYFDSHNS